MKISTALKLVLGTAALSLPLMASAASTYVTGGGTLTASATVGFSVVIPRVLYLRVGTGSAYNATTPVLSTVATTDQIVFSPAAGTVGNGTAVAGTGGDLTNGVETAAVVSNAGSVTLTSASTGALSDGAGDTIPFTQITTAATANTATYTLLNAPVLSNGAGSTITLTAPASKVINADAKWTYSYANSVSAPGGTYGVTAANNGIVTYTATMP